MERIRKEIIESVGLSNNGYTSREITLCNVYHAMDGKASVAAIGEAFDSLLRVGKLSKLGEARGTVWVCLPEDYRKVKATLQELAAGL